MKTPIVILSLLTLTCSGMDKIKLIHIEKVNAWATPGTYKMDATTISNMVGTKSIQIGTNEVKLRSITKRMLELGWKKGMPLSRCSPEAQRYIYDLNHALRFDTPGIWVPIRSVGILNANTNGPGRFTLVMTCYGKGKWMDFEFPSDEKWTFELGDKTYTNSAALRLNPAVFVGKYATGSFSNTVSGTHIFNTLSITTNPLPQRIHISRRPTLEEVSRSFSDRP